MITRLLDNADFFCVHVVGRFSKDFWEVHGLRSRGFQLQVEWMTTVLCAELRKKSINVMNVKIISCLKYVTASIKHLLVFLAPDMIFIGQLEKDLNDAQCFFFISSK